MVNGLLGLCRGGVISSPHASCSLTQMVMQCVMMDKNEQVDPALIR